MSNQRKLNPKQSHIGLDDMQSGRLSVLHRGSCEFRQMNQKLWEKGNLAQLRKGQRVYTAIQSINYTDHILSEIMEKFKTNNYLIEEYSKDSKYNKLLQSILDITKVIIEQYQDYNLRTGNLYLTRIQKPNFSKEIEFFLNDKVLPPLRKISRLSVLENKFNLNQNDENIEAKYEKYFEEYLKFSILQNYDLHYYIHYVYDVLDQLTDGDINFNSIFLVKDVPLFEFEAFLNPTALAIGYFFYKLLSQKQMEKQIYNQNTLPKLTFINLDGFDYGKINFNQFADTSSLQYITLFDDLVVLNSSHQRTESSILDTFVSPIQQRQQGGGNKTSNTNQISGFQGQTLEAKALNNSFFLPLLSKEIEERANYNSQQAGQEKITSGKYREIFRNYIIPIVQKFQPEVVIISHSLSTNKFSHPNSNISINDKVFAEILQELSIASNSRVMYSPRFVKANRPHNFLVSNKLPDPTATFDELYFMHVENNYSFQSQDQIQLSAQYVKKIFGTFLQIQQGQWNNRLAKRFSPNQPQQIAGKWQFQRRMTAFIKYLDKIQIPLASQLFPAHIDHLAHSQLCHRISALKLAQERVLQNLNNSNLSTQNSLKSTNNSNEIQETISKIVQNPKSILRSIEPSYSNIHLIFESVDNEKNITFSARRCFFKTNEGYLSLNKYTQYYIDYGQKCVFLFNALKYDNTYSNYLFYIPNKYSDLKEGMLEKYERIPEIFDPSQDKKVHNDKRIPVLIEFSVTTYKSQIFVVFGKILNEDNSFKVSPFIFFLNFQNIHKNQPEGWVKISIEPDENKPESFIQNVPNLEQQRLYASAIVVNKSLEKLDEPVLFIIGGILLPQGNQTPNICNIITRLVPKKSDELGSRIWLGSNLQKNTKLPSIRPLCNSLTLEVEKGKIMIIGGTHYKYQAPFNNPITCYIFSMEMQQQTVPNKKKQNDSSNSTLLKVERDWKLSQINIEDNQKFSNASFSSLNRNLIFSGKNSVSGETYAIPFFIVLNNDQVKFERPYVKNNLQQSHQTHIINTENLKKDGSWEDKRYSIQIYNHQESLHQMNIQPSTGVQIQMQQQQNSNKGKKQTKSSSKTNPKIEEVQVQKNIPMSVNLEWSLTDEFSLKIHQSSQNRRKQECQDFVKQYFSNQSFGQSELQHSQFQSSISYRETKASTFCSNDSSAFFKTIMSISDYHQDQNKYKENLFTKNSTIYEDNREKMTDESDLNFYSKESQIETVKILQQISANQLNEYQTKLQNFGSSFKQEQSHQKHIWADPNEYYGLTHLLVADIFWDQQQKQRAVTLKGTSFRDKYQFTKVIENSIHDEIILDNETNHRVHVLGSFLSGSNILLNDIILVEPNMRQQFQFDNQKSLQIKVNISTTDTHQYESLPIGSLKRIQHYQNKIYLLANLSDNQWIVYHADSPSCIEDKNEIEFDILLKFPLIEFQKLLNTSIQDIPTIKEMVFAVFNSEVCFFPVLSTKQLSQQDINYATSLDKQKMSDIILSQKMQIPSLIINLNNNTIKDVKGCSQWLQQCASSVKVVQNNSPNQSKSNKEQESEEFTYDFICNRDLGKIIQIESAIMCQKQILHLTVSFTNDYLDPCFFVTGLRLQGLSNQTNKMSEHSRTIELIPNQFKEKKQSIKMIYQISHASDQILISNNGGTDLVNLYSNEMNESIVNQIYNRNY